MVGSVVECVIYFDLKWLNKVWIEIIVFVVVIVFCILMCVSLVVKVWIWKELKINDVI